MILYVYAWQCRIQENYVLQLVKFEYEPLSWMGVFHEWNTLC